MNSSEIRTLVRGAYDIQKLRIQMGNRIVQNFKTKLGQTPGTSEKELKAEEQKILKTLRVQFKKITDGVKVFPRQSNFKGDEIISTYTELCLVAQYVELESQEDAHFRRLESVLRDYPAYVNVLSPIKGIGPAIGGVILSEIDIHKAKYASSLWKLAGLDVGPDGQGRSKRKEHLVQREYTTKDGEVATKNSITFNPFLKTKMYLLGESLIKCNEYYKTIYDNYKNRLVNHPAHVGKTPKHRANMALRYMVKRCLVDIYKQWRALEGLEVFPEYSEAKLGLKHAA